MSGVPAPLRRASRGAALALHLAAERVDGAAHRRARRAEEPEVGAPSPSAPAPAAPDLWSLVDASLTQNAATAKQAFLDRLVGQLLPDEARIVVLLARSGPVPLVHVYPRSGTGPVLEYASLAGRVAGVTLPSLTPDYVAHLVRLGLVEVGPAAEGRERDYELLMADRAVRAALRGGMLGKIPARTVRATARLTDRGQELVDAARGESR